MSLNPPTLAIPKISHHFDMDLFETLLDQLDSAVSVSGGRRNIDQWIINNTSDPLNPNKPWSFIDHEYQIGIVASQAPRNIIMKASQIGVSEIIVRLVLALLAKMPGRHAIYTLPDAGFARGFAPSRFDPVVDASKKLKALVSQDLNNNKLKKVGSSYLHITGSQKESQSISVPASILVHDEFAYSQPEVLGTFNSRLGHLKAGEEIVYAFSTALFPHADIHAAYLTGTCEAFALYHRGCNSWVILDPLLSLRIPGYDGLVELFTKEDLKDIDPSKAYIECPNCRSKIDLENLSEAAARAWVPEFPGRSIRSFDANYLVAPAIRPPEKILRGRGNYRSTAKWLNFDVGRPADSSDSRITDTAIEQAFSLPPEDTLVSYLNVVGMDVGKIGHLIGARKINQELHITYSERPVQDSDNYLATRFVEHYKQSKSRRGVIDAGPEFTVVTKSQESLAFGQVYGCYFVKTTKQDLEFFKADEEKGIVTAQRTKAFNEFVNDFNEGRVRFKRNDPNAELIKKHLKNLVRVTDINELGDEMTTWRSIGEDHFLFATFYAWLAAEMLEDSTKGVVLPSGHGLVAKTRMKG